MDGANDYINSELIEGAMDLSTHSTPLPKKKHSFINMEAENNIHSERKQSNKMQEPLFKGTLQELYQAIIENKKYFFYTDAPEPSVKMKLDNNGFLNVTLPNFKFRPHFSLRYKMSNDNKAFYGCDKRTNEVITATFVDDNGNIDATGEGNEIYNVLRKHPCDDVKKNNSINIQVNNHKNNQDNLLFNSQVDMLEEHKRININDNNKLNNNNANNINNNYQDENNIENNINNHNEKENVQDDNALKNTHNSLFDNLDKNENDFGDFGKKSEDFDLSSSKSNNDKNVNKQENKNNNNNNPEMINENINDDKQVSINSQNPLNNMNESNNLFNQDIDRQDNIFNNNEIIINNNIPNSQNRLNNMNENNNNLSGQNNNNQIYQNENEFNNNNNSNSQYKKQEKLPNNSDRCWNNLKWLDCCGLCRD